MAGSLNKAMLIGNVGKDPEIRHTQDGKEIANLVLATSDSWRDKNTGEKRERTEWHRIVIFKEGLIGIIKNYVGKGSKVFVEGSLQTRKWTDNQGNEKYSTEIVLQGPNASITMLDKPGGAKGGSGSGLAGSQNSGGEASENNNNKFSYDELDDEIPF